jgi:hypothetical protein
MPRTFAASLLLLAGLLLSATASAHPGEAESGYQGKGFMSLLAAQSTGLAAADLNTSRVVPTTPSGPCTEQAKGAMPVGEGHDHQDMKQHALRCRMERVAFLPLLEELGARKDVILGEMDVKADIAAVAITFPRAGALFFDVSDPANPKFLSRYDGTECDQAIIDINCGAFVDLSADGKTAFLSVQKLSFAPAQPSPNPGGQSGPGVEVIDLTDPKRPIVNFTYPVGGLGGVHTSRSHVIPEGPSSANAPRRPGEYVFSNQNGLGIDIARVRVVGGRRILEKLPPQRNNTAATCNAVTICNREVHDTFIQNDPLDGRTYLYNAAGFDSGFQVYDVTDPEKAKLVAEWDLTPECTEDWYAHTIDVTHKNGRRFVTMPAELFLLKDDASASGLDEQSKAEQDKGCGRFVGNGDRPGPMWIVDATDFSKLGPAEDREAPERKQQTAGDLKRASEAALVTTWTNPAGRAGGSLTFSPHNQQIVGDKIYLSHYHGGVFVLDASAAFSGRQERPSELAFHVPDGEPVRPLLGQPVGFGLAGRFFTDFPLGRSETWDMVFYKGHVLAADMTGGFYSLRETSGSAAGSASPAAPAAPAASTTAGSTAAQRPAPAAPGCTPVNGFRSATVAPQRGRVRLAFARSVDRPVQVDVFQQSVGRRVVGERLVARFAGRSSAFTWDGRANRAGRRVTDGYYLVRYRIALPNGQADVRRLVLRRVRGRFSGRPASYRRATCGLLGSYKLERPVFGGRSNRALAISFRLAREARVTVTVRRGSRVIKRFGPARRRGSVTHRLRLPAELLARGDHRVELVATPATGQPVRATLTARRL